MAGKVLIADDSLKVQKELTQLLKDAGIDAVTVSNGEHAVRKLPGEKPDLVLADIFMPVRSGYEVCDYIKNSPEFGHVAVLLLVSKMEPFDEAEAKRVRADGKVEKPLSDREAVLAAVQQHLEKAASVAPSPEPTQEFAEATPSTVEEEAEPEPEPEAFSTRPPQVSFGEQAAPMGFADVEEEAPAAEAPPAEEAPAEEPADPSQATRLTTADELQRRAQQAEPPSPRQAFSEEAPPAPEEPAPAEEAPPAGAPPPVAGFEPPPPPPPGEETKIEKPEVAAPWEMTGPEPGAPEVRPAGGWESQWSGGEGQEETVEEAAPAAEEAPAQPDEERSEPEEFTAAFGAGEAGATEPAPAPVEESPAAAPEEIDPAVVDQVVEEVLQRLSPQVMETIAREIVRPLAEALLKERRQK